MSKKDFSGGFNSLLGDQPKKAEQPALKRGRPKTNFKDNNEGARKGTKEGETRATFILREDLLDKVKGIAYWDRLLFKDVLNTALEEFTTKYEKKNGPIKPIPKK